VGAGTRGLEAVAALSGSSLVAAGSVDLSKDLINELLRSMLDKGAEFENPVIFVTHSRNSKFLTSMGMNQKVEMLVE